MERIIEITRDDYHNFVLKTKQPIPYWLNTKFTDHSYSKKLYLISMKGKKINGFWIVPIVNDKNGIIAKRDFRFFPYASPYILETDNLKRRKVSYDFFSFLKERSNIFTYAYRL